MTSGNAEYGIQLPLGGPHDRGSRNMQTDVGAATDTEMAICSTILLGKAEYGIQLPPEGPHDRGSRNMQTDVGAATDTEMAICSTILLGKVDATGSYNVDGHAVSIEELQKQLGNLRDRN